MQNTILYAKNRVALTGGSEPKNERKKILKAAKQQNILNFLMNKIFQKMSIQRARKTKTGRERETGNHLYVCSDTFH